MLHHAAGLHVLNAELYRIKSEQSFVSNNTHAYCYSTLPVLCALRSVRRLNCVCFLMDYLTVMLFKELGCD